MAETFFDNPYLCGLPQIPALNYDFTSSCSVSPTPLENIYEFPNAGNLLPLDPLPPAPEIKFFGSGRYVDPCADFRVETSSFSSACPKRVQGYVLDFQIPLPCPDISLSTRLFQGESVSNVDVSGAAIANCETCTSLLDFRFPCPNLTATICGGGTTVNVVRPSSESVCVPQFNFGMAPIEVTAGATVAAATTPAVGVTVTPQHRSNTPTCFNDPFKWDLDFAFNLPRPQIILVSGNNAACGGNCSSVATIAPVTTPSGCCPGPADYFLHLQNTPRKLTWNGAHWVAPTFDYVINTSSSVATTASLSITNCNRLGTQLSLPGVGVWKNTRTAFRNKKGGRLSLVEYICWVDPPCEIDICADGTSYMNSSASYSSANPPDCDGENPTTFFNTTRVFTLTVSGLSGTFSSPARACAGFNRSWTLTWSAINLSWLQSVPYIGVLYQASIFRAPDVVGQPRKIRLAFNLQDGGDVNTIYEAPACSYPIPGTTTFNLVSANSCTGWPATINVTCT